MDKKTAWSTGRRDEILERIRQHKAADEIVQGIGWDGYVGCAIGCSLHRYDHQEYARSVTGCEILAEMVDSVHEGLPQEEATGWPLRFAESLAEGADTSHVASELLLWALEQKDCPRHKMAHELLEREWNGDHPTEEEWNELEENDYELWWEITEAVTRHVDMDTVETVMCLTTEHVDLDQMYKDIADKIVDLCKNAKVVAT